MSQKDMVAHPHTNNDLPHTATVTGAGELANFEITTDGELAVSDGTGVEDAVIVSEASAEGVIVDDVIQFDFSGSITNYRVVNEDGLMSSDSSSYPSITIDYGRSE